MKNAMKDIKNVMDTLITLGDEEMKQSEPYKKLFEESTVEGVLRDAEFQMMEIILAANDIIEKKHGVKMNNDKYKILKGLPLFATLLEKDITEKSGTVCCVDKTYYLLAEAIKKHKE